jgi:hypothetical protein
MRLMDIMEAGEPQRITAIGSPKELVNGFADGTVASFEFLMGFEDGFHPVISLRQPIIPSRTKEATETDAVVLYASQMRLRAKYMVLSVDESRLRSLPAFRRNTKDLLTSLGAHGYVAGPISGHKAMRLLGWLMGTVRSVGWNVRVRIERQEQPPSRRLVGIIGLGDMRGETGIHQSWRAAKTESGDWVIFTRVNNMGWHYSAWANRFETGEFEKILKKEQRGGRR